MADHPIRLTAKSAFGAALPVRHGTVTLSEPAAGAVTWIAPLNGKGAAVSSALKRQIGAALPEPGESTGTGDGGPDGARVIWAGPGQAFVLGPQVKPIAGAAMTDQSSAWARCALDGRDAAKVLARLVPVDLRDAAFPSGRTARTQLGHMACSLTRVGPDRFEIMVFRSMAATALHELDRAMGMVAARVASAHRA